MSDIFLGLIFILFDFSIGNGEFSIGLIPDAAGYIFLISGFGKLADKSAFFPYGKKWCVFLAAFTGIHYVAELFGLLNEFPSSQWLCGVFTTAGSIAVSFFTVRAYRDIEVTADTNLEVRHLMTMWLACSVVRGLSYMLQPVPLLGLAGTVASIILSIVFLVSFRKTEKLAAPHI